MPRTAASCQTASIMYDVYRKNATKNSWRRAEKSKVAKKAECNIICEYEQKKCICKSNMVQEIIRLYMYKAANWIVLSVGMKFLLHKAFYSTLIPVCLPH